MSQKRDRDRADERDRAAEMNAHIELYIEQLVARGRSPEDARREARLHFGNPRVKLEEVREMRRFAFFDSINRDLRYALRVLRRTPAFTLTAIVTLALAIGANTAVFSLANAIILQPLPYPEPDRLGLVATRTSSPRGEGVASWQDGLAWEAVRDRLSSVDAAVYVAGASGANLYVGESALFVQQQRVSSGYFRVLGVAPFIGRELSAEEDLPHGPRAAVLSHRIWKRLFNGDMSVVGSSILLRGEPYTVVGVMPETFVNPADADVWTSVQPNTNGEGSGTNYRVLVRLKSGVTWERADSELAATSGPDLYRNRGYRDDTQAVQTLLPLQDEATDGVRQPVVMLGAAVGAVLLIACVNLATLLLARGTSRSKEIATRMALGSGRAAVVRQLMVEAGVLALAGGALGLVVGAIGLEGLKTVGGSTYNDWSRVDLDAGVIGVTIALSAVTSVIFGLLPAVQASRLDVQAALADAGSRSIAGGSRHWGQRVLVVSEVALGVVLLVTAGLLVRTFVSLRSLDPGFDPSNLLTTTVSLQDARYQSSSQVAEFVDDTLRRLEHAPGVESAAVSLELPYDRLLNMSFSMLDDPGLKRTITNVTYVTPRFLETFRLPLRRGRDVTERDGASGQRVVLVNEAWVRFYSTEREPIGRHIRIAGEEREIVGVTGNVQQRESFSIAGMTAGPLVSAPLVFMPLAQTSGATLNMVHTWFRPTWTVRARSAGEAGEALRRAISDADPMLPVAGVISMDEVMAGATSQQRLLMTLIGVLAAAALLLAAIGIHGLIAQSVIERRREFGIRLALGATAGGTVLSVARGGIVLAAIGAALGGLLSIPASGLVEAFLWGVSELDPLTYVGVAVFLLGVAALASVLPALRILRLDPATTLRS